VHGASYVKHNRKLPLQGGIQVAAEKFLLLLFRVTIGAVVKIKARLPDGGKAFFRGKRFQCPQQSGGVETRRILSPIAGGGKLRVDGKAEQQGRRAVPIRFTGNLFLRRKFRRIPGARGAGNDKAAAFFLRTGKAFKEIQRMGVRIRSHG
jgi:hypothetical protein